MNSFAFKRFMVLAIVGAVMMCCAACDDNQDNSNDTNVAQETTSAIETSFQSDNASVEANQYDDVVIVYGGNK